MSDIEYVDVAAGEIRIKVHTGKCLSWDPKNASTETVRRCIDNSLLRAHRRLNGLKLVSKLLDQGAVDQRTPAERFRAAAEEENRRIGR